MADVKALEDKLVALKLEWEKGQISNYDMTMKVADLLKSEPQLLRVFNQATRAGALKGNVAAKAVRLAVQLR